VVISRKEGKIPDDFVVKKIIILSKNQELASSEQNNIEKYKAKESFEQLSKQRITPTEIFKEIDNLPPPPTVASKPQIATLPIPKTITKPKVQIKEIDNKDRERGLEYFNEKRWDLANEYLKKYLILNSPDKETESKIEIANINADKAIKLYNAGRKAQKENDLKNAYEYYRMAHDIYPLLYDCWERIQSLKKEL